MCSARVRQVLISSVALRSFCTLRFALSKEERNLTISSRAAEFRGPGNHHGHRYDDSPEDLDMDMMDHKARSFGHPGRIILLGDGTELTSSEVDSDMFDHDDEDNDLAEQIQKGAHDDDDDDDDLDASELRRQREGTPAPSGTPVLGGKVTAEPTSTDSPSSTKKEDSEVDKKSTAAASTETKKV